MSEYLQLRDAVPQLLALADDFREDGARADREGVAPKASLQTLHAKGLLHVTHSAALGGPDGSLKGSQPELFLNMLRMICRADSSTGHCFQLHNHALWQLEQVGTDEQIERFLKPALKKLSIFRRWAASLAVSTCMR